MGDLEKGLQLVNQAVSMDNLQMHNEAKKLYMEANVFFRRAQTGMNKENGQKKL